MSMMDTNALEKRIAERIDQKSAALMKIDAARTSGIAFTDMGQVMEFAKVMAVSDVGVRKHLRGNVGACLACTIQAIEWEMSPFAVASKSYSVNDQIAYEAQLINAVILRRAPIVGRFKITYAGTGDTRVCTVALAMRDGGPDAVYESPVFSKIHPKNSPLWKSDPDQQQFYYSSRALCRRHFPDVLLGVYAVDEIIDSADFEPTPAARSPQGSRSKDIGDRIDRLVSGTTIEGESFDPETGEIGQAATNGNGAATAESSKPKPTAPAQAADDIDPYTGKPLSEGPANSNAPAQGGATAEASQTAQEGAQAASGTAATAAPANPQDTLLADLRATAKGRAQGGVAALRNFLDNLEPGERAMLSDAEVRELMTVAKGVKAK